MPGVHWSRRARAKLETISPAVREQLTSNAGEILHNMSSTAFPHDEGFEGRVMWHRGIPCGARSQELLAQEDDDELPAQEDDDGPWNYFLFYKLYRSGPGEPVEYVEVLDICGIDDVAEQWKKMESGVP